MKSTRLSQARLIIIAMTLGIALAISAAISAAPAVVIAQESGKCEESDYGQNDEGNNAGNPHCFGSDARFEDGNGQEPTRDCFGGNRDNNGVDGQGLHKQALDDKDGDGTACADRGNND